MCNSICDKKRSLHGENRRYVLYLLHIRSRILLGKHLEKQRGAKRKSLLDYSCKLAHSAVKYGSEIANSCDPLAAAIAVGGKSGIGVALSRFSASQCAGLIGVIVTSITPHVRERNIFKKFNSIVLGICSSNP